MTDIKTWYEGFAIECNEHAKAESQWRVPELKDEAGLTRTFASLKAAKLAIGKHLAPDKKETARKEKPFTAYIVRSKGRYSYDDSADKVCEIEVISYSSTQHRIYFRPVGWTLSYGENAWVDYRYSETARIHLSKESAEAKVAAWKAAHAELRKAQTAEQNAENAVNKGMEIKAIANKLGVQYVKSSRY